jgi:hypothetical protein
LNQTFINQLIDESCGHCAPAELERWLIRIGFVMVLSVSTPLHTAPAARHRWLVLGIVSVALLLIVIDMTVLYTALPRLTHDLAASASAKLWIINIYALVVSGLLLGMGTLGDKLGHKTMLLSGLVVFGAASLLAAFAPDTGVLIAACTAGCGRRHDDAGHAVGDPTELWR